MQSKYLNKFRMLNPIKIAALVIAARAQTAVIDSFSPLVPMKDYVPPSDLDSTPGLYYPADYRVLNCWECFEAQGKMCIEQGQNSLFLFTRSSDPGNAFCCKPDSNTGFCESGSKHYQSTVSMTTVCSQPSYGSSSAATRNILTDNRNHQMFAFCPHITPSKCGIPASGAEGQKVYAQ